MNMIMNARDFHHALSLGTLYSFHYTGRVVGAKNSSGYTNFGRLEKMGQDVERNSHIIVFYDDRRADKRKTFHAKTSKFRAKKMRKTIKSKTEPSFPNLWRAP